METPKTLMEAINMFSDPTIALNYLVQIGKHTAFQARRKADICFRYGFQSTEIKQND